jgi:uncharacterized phage infection (PIP) family protein YhgE
MLSIASGISFWMWKIHLRKSMGAYYEMFISISKSKKEIHRSVKTLDRYLRRAIKEQFPKINKLCRKAETHVKKIQEIDKVLSSLEAKRELEYQQHTQQLENRELTAKISESYKRYNENIRAIQTSKNQYLQQVQQVLHFLEELNSQILALKYSRGDMKKIGTEIAETIDDLLIEMQTLKEIS